MVKNDLYRKIEWSQSGRWYWWKFGPDFKNNRSVIINNSANTHIIPATETITDAIDGIDPGDRIELTGFLTTIVGKKDGQTYTWNSSLSRSDTGNGSCEVLYVKKITDGGRTVE
jgi:hypothetical protein